MSQWLSGAGREVGMYLPTLGMALAILIGGFLVAYLLRAITLAALRRTGIGQRVSHGFGAHDAPSAARVESWIAKAVFYTTLAFVFVAFFSQLRINAVTDPIVRALSGITGAIPNLLKAALIGFAGYLLAKLAKSGVSTLIDRTHLSDRLARIAGDAPEGLAETQTLKPGTAEGTTYREVERAPIKAKKLNWLGHTKLASTAGEIAYWVVLAITAVPVLEALSVGVLAIPLSRAIEAITTYAPRVIGAAILLAIGYLVARFTKKAISALAHRIGVDRLVTRVGGERVMRGQSLSSILGTIAMAFVLLHFAISAVGRLEIAEISGPLTGFLAAIYTFLPRLFVGALVLAVGIVLARLVGNLAARLLAGMGFNTLMAQIGIYRGEQVSGVDQEVEAKALINARRGVSRVTYHTGSSINGTGADDLLSGGATLATAKTPSDVGGLVVTAAIAIIFLRQALGTMQLQGFAQLLDTVLAFLPNLFVAAVILAAAMAAGNWGRQRVRELTGGSDDRLMRSLDQVVYVAIITVGVMMAAQQLGVGSQLIGTAFTLILGAVCLALALAFGLGGREVAGDFLRKEVSRRQRGSMAPGE
ncbi:MAG: mechanosensitive ion channel [Myxococcales bacterium]